MDPDKLLKWGSLLFLVLQNTTLVLVMRTSQLESNTYKASTAVVLSELLKLIISAFIYTRQKYTSSPRPVRVNDIINDLFGPKSMWKSLCVPSVLYFIQNNLQYMAIALLEPATFQVTYQLKILTTALFSVLLLNNTLSMRKWFSMVLLTIGIALVQLPKSGSGDTKELSFFIRFGGLIVVLLACILSGLAGVWFERVLKGSTASLWLRNTQLSFFSLVIGFFLGVVIVDGSDIYNNGFFFGYTRHTYYAILCQAIGGLIVSLVVKFADNILKGFATSLSIILSCVISVLLFDFQITSLFVVGASIVLLSTFLYTSDVEVKKRSFSPLPTTLDGK